MNTEEEHTFKSRNISGSTRKILDLWAQLTLRIFLSIQNAAEVE